MRLPDDVFPSAATQVSRLKLNTGCLIGVPAYVTAISSLVPVITSVSPVFVSGGGGDLVGSLAKLNM
jgi:hypothetical protein